jgi:hypothetical protein
VAFHRIGPDQLAAIKVCSKPRLTEVGQLLSLPSMLGNGALGPFRESLSSCLSDLSSWVSSDEAKRLNQGGALLPPILTAVHGGVLCTVTIQPWADG